MLDQYTYVFAIGTLFALLDAYNNGASEFPAARAPAPRAFLLLPPSARPPSWLLGEGAL